MSVTGTVALGFIFGLSLSYIYPTGALSLRCAPLCFNCGNQKIYRSFCATAMPFFFLSQNQGRNVRNFSVSYREAWMAEGEAELMLRDAVRSIQTQKERIIHLLDPTF